MDSTIKLLLINGHRDTRNSVGTNYNTIIFADIAALVETPLTLAKLDAPAFVASSYTASDARSHSAQRQNGQFYAFVVDVDEDGPALAAVDAAVTAIFGDCAHHLLHEQCVSRDPQMARHYAFPYSS